MATSIDKIIDALFADLNDRSGLGLDSLDAVTQAEIRKNWRAIIERETLPYGEVLDRGFVTHYQTRNGDRHSLPSVSFTARLGEGEYTHVTTEAKVMKQVLQTSGEWPPTEVALVLLPKHALAMYPRDREWSEALANEFKIGGAILPHDDKWVREKKTLPERWARIVRLVTAPPGTKLHNYLPPQPIKLDPEKQ